MFNVKISRKEYQVDFDHVRGDNAIFYLGHEGTYCEISIDNGDVKVAKGHTEINPSDNYCRNFGRKLSLARALKNGGFNKDERTEFWKMYFNTRGKVD